MVEVIERAAGGAYSPDDAPRSAADRCYEATPGNHAIPELVLAGARFESILEAPAPKLVVMPLLARRGWRKLRSRLGIEQVVDLLDSRLARLGTTNDLVVRP